MKANAVDSRRIRHAIDWVERNERIDGVEAINVMRSPYGVAPDDNWNGKVQSEEVAAVNVTNLNLHIEDSFKQSREGIWQIIMPPQITRLSANPVVFQDMMGAQVVMGGGNLGQGATPDATSAYNESTPTSSQFYGTEFFGLNYGSEAIFAITDSYCFRWIGGGIRGEGTDPANAGIRISKASGGLGPATLYFEQVAIHNCDIGVDVGRVVVAGLTGSVNGTTFDDAAVSNWTNTTISTSRHKLYITAVNSGDAVVGEYDISTIAAGNLTLGSSASTGVSSVVYHIGSPQADETQGYLAANCSEVVMMQPLMKVCTYGYESTHGQAVNHLLIMPQFNEGDALYKITGGGGMTMIHPVTYEAEAVVEATGGGSNTGITLVLGGRLDTAGVANTKLWNATDDFFNVGVFFGGGAVYNASVPNGARITAQPNNYVSVYHWHNLNDSGGSKTVFESAATGAKVVGLYGVWLISDAARSWSRSAVIGTWHSTGDWVVRDCIDNTNGVRVADAEYPRLNGRSSTHRYRVERDFESNEVAPFVISASGTGAGSDSVFPWSTNNVGILSINTGTTNTGSSACITHTEAMAVTGGPWLCEILARLIALSVTTGGDPDPSGVAAPYAASTTGGTITGVTGDSSDADETFVVRLGFCDSATGDGTDAIMFRYTNSVNSGKWQAVTRDGGSETATDTGVTADQTASLFEIRVNPVATSVTFYINGTLVATNTTNIPDSTDYMGMMPGSIVKTAGTNNRSFHIDYAYYDFIPTTARQTAFSR